MMRTPYVSKSSIPVNPYWSFAIVCPTFGLPLSTSRSALSRQPLSWSTRHSRRPCAEFILAPVSAAAVEAGGRPVRESVVRHGSITFGGNYIHNTLAADCTAGIVSSSASLKWLERQHWTTSWPGEQADELARIDCTSIINNLTY
jgi:hypothetical protein